MTTSIIAAFDRHRVIGRDNDLPWHLPDDLKHFKRLTSGHAVLMGRRTYLSIGRPLPNRRNLVLSSDRSFTAPGIEVFHDLDSAWQSANDAEHLFVAGGASVFAATIDRVDDMYLTRVDAEVEGDVYFPAIDWQRWQCVQETEHPADNKHAHPFRIGRYRRV